MACLLDMSILCDCGMTFTEQKTYNRHRKRSRIHRPDLNYGPFRCKNCPRRLPKKCRMKQHQRHLGHSGILKDQEVSSWSPGETGLNKSFRRMRVSQETDLYDLREEDFCKFIAHNVQADRQFLGCCGEVIKQLVESLQDSKTIPDQLKSSQVIKGGSLGKGTAVKDRSDIDIVLMLNNYNDVSEIMCNMETILASLKLHLDLHKTAATKTQTRFSVPAVVTCDSGHQHDVDILPGVDLLGLGYSCSEIYDMMNGKSDTIHEFSVSLAPLQVDIIGALPTKVKSLIQLVKFWKDKKLKGPSKAEMSSFADRKSSDRKWPSSYALELVVMWSWIQNGEKNDFDMSEVLKTVLRTLIDHEKMSIKFPSRMKYDSNRIARRSPPYLMDPANPYNDMYHGLVDGKAFDWSLVSCEAQCWLQRLN